MPVLALVLSMFAAADAGAVGQRTFVASNGNNGNPCTLLLPCRDFAYAISQVNAGGEVVALDSAGFGPVTITKAVSIIAPPGVYAGMSIFPGTDGITIAAGSSDKVVLRGLTINGQGGDRGIVINSAGEVHIEQCTVSGVGTNGIEINGGSHIQIRSTIVRGSGANGAVGNGLAVTAGTPIVDVVHSQFARNLSNGILLNTGTLTIADSTLSDNGGSGAAAVTGVGATARMSVVRTTSSRNSAEGFYGLILGGGTVFLSVTDSAAVENTDGLLIDGTTATAVVTRSTFTGNSNKDLIQNLGVLRSSGNNTLTSGAGDVSGVLTANPLQ